jgi:hypothetical protein
MVQLLRLLCGALIGLFQSSARREAEILVLRQQINVLRRKSPKRPALNNAYVLHGVAHWSARFDLNGETKRVSKKQSSAIIAADVRRFSYLINADDVFGTHNLIRDRDAVYGAVVTRRLRAMGIRDKPISAGSPWQNGFAERLIGTIRRECVDHLVVFGEAHLRRVLIKFAAYYNECRIHRSLNKDAPFHRVIERLGAITTRPVLGGLHHQYCRT